MAFPVRVYKKHPAEGGKIRKVITSKQLWKRFDEKVKLEASAELSTRPAKLKNCKACGNTFMTQDERYLYCPKGCALAVKKEQDRASSRRRREREKEKKLKKKSIA